MGMPKPSEDDRAWFAALLPDHPEVSRRPMFGNLAGFARDQMFLCLLGPTVAVRLGADDRAELLAEAGAAPFEPMASRPMTEYVALPHAWRGDPERARSWVDRSLSYALTLPPKAAKKPRQAKQAGARSRAE